MERRVRINDGQGVSSRKVPIPHLRVAATAMGSANTLYTVRDRASFQLQQLAVVNTGMVAVTLSLHSVPSGGAAATGNTELNSLSIAANASVDLTAMLGGFYVEGTTLLAFASVSDALVVHGWGEEIL